MARKTVTYTIEDEVVEMLEQASEDEYRSKSGIVQEALLAWLRNRNYGKRVSDGGNE